MLVRLGYVAISLMLQDCSTAKTVTVKTLSGIKDEDARLNKLRRIAGQNIKNTLRVLRHNISQEIFLYRFSSQTIPLATHPLTAHWDYLGEFGSELKKLGACCRENGLRVSTHPDHFTLINSPDDTIVANSVKDLNYHAGLFEAMGLDYDTKMVMHIGGVYKDKENSLKRFIRNFAQLPPGIQKRIILENDDRSYDAADVLGTCRKLKIPFVLDLHHHRILNRGEKIGNLLPYVYATWNDAIPKLHFSSPKSPEKVRHHAENIDPDDFYSFMMEAREINRDIDIMLEAKNKDLAIFDLVKEMAKRKGITMINGASLLV